MTTASDTREGRLTLISGLDGKSPACFLVEAHGVRILLDLGAGPAPDDHPDVSGIGRVDAVLISHCHTDHAGGLALLEHLGNPNVFATAETWAIIDHARASAPKQTPPPAQRKLLPLQGTLEIAGITVLTGRDGHAPGGVWLRLGIGGGLLYTGDYSTESNIYPLDPPPAAELAIIDASYGAADEAIGVQIGRLAELLSHGGVLPVPVGGRGPELALRLQGLGLKRPWLDPQVFDQMERIASGNDRSAAPEAHAAAARFLATKQAADPARDDIVIATNGAADSGLAADLLEQWGSAVPFVFTGHIPPGTPAAAAMARGEAQWQRVNVHPRLSDNARLVRSIGASRVVPAFSKADERPALAHAVAPALLLTDREIPIG